ncbi:hypothetical protein LB553_11180 [Mesorhizobium sp. CA8]|uniref:hypothetical protein n=1 Tax=Mesorhizobium sp. CA8 TaxID=2876637 RepID=UPI001CCDEF9D|nr:hypothetical protein [Mesorhizobium sp. CA8]MBZ9761435.1 hypothetical protein [Mesorhizobium sp. CA8]
MGLKIVDVITRAPAIIAAKEARNRLVYTAFEHRGRAAGRAFADRLKATGASRVCFAVAFNTPWVIDALAKAWQMHPPGMTLAVVDNSTGRASREAIESICKVRDVPYLALPMRVEKHLSRSHGTAINWTYHNIIRHLEPELFGFIDHDCFPVVPFDIPAKMEEKAVYGKLFLPGRNHIHEPKPTDRHWNLWAGFCFYRFSATAGRKLNFEPRLNMGLDTGGANWKVLYSHLDRASDVAVAVARENPMTMAGAVGHHEIIEEAFFHVAGVSYPDRPSYHRRTTDHRKLIRDYVWNTYLGGTSGRVAQDF